MEEMFIESLDGDGLGITRWQGREALVRGGLPGERVLTEQVGGRCKRMRDAVLVLEASPDRVEPMCPYYGVCGGCRLQHLSLKGQLAFKQKRLMRLLADRGVTAVNVSQPIEGPHRYYRRRARLAAKFVEKKGGMLVGFRERDARFVADMDHCMILDERLSMLIRPLRDMIGELTIRSRIPQIEATAGDGCVSLTLRCLEAPSTSDREIMSACARTHNVELFLQAAGPDSVEPLTRCDARELDYVLPLHGLRFVHGPLDFVQINATVNEALIEQVIEHINPRQGMRIADLFCGIGNFALPLARRGAHVSGFELHAGQVERARANAAANDLDSRSSFTVCDLNAPAACADLDPNAFDALMLDPPRSGAETFMRTLDRGPAVIVYVSCNPTTLARDAGILVREKGYTMTSVRVVDMFPHTLSAEALAVFTRS